MKLITKAIENKFSKFPLYSQDGKGDKAAVIAKFFNPYGDGTWYVLEAGEAMENGDRELYALCVFHGEAEYGYLMLSDLTDTKVRVWGHEMPLERDLYFSGTVADAKRDAGIA